MTKSKSQRPVRPPASGKRLDDAIEQSLKTLDSLPRLRTNGKLQKGPLVWKVMLEMSRAGLDKGRAPSIRKQDLAFELKRSHQSAIEVDHDLWNSYLKFHQRFGSRLREGNSSVGQPVLALERLTNNGLGGDPEKTEAVYWLCYDSGSQAEADGSAIAPDAAEYPKAARADEITACAAKGSTASAKPSTPQSSDTPMGEGSEQRAASTEAAPERVEAAATCTNATGKLQAAPSELYLLWLAALLSRTERSSGTPAALVLALALLAPALGYVSAEIISPVQALTDSISSLADVFKGSIGIRT
ncbi:MAG: hypothetical protein KA973_19205 [Candidatus Microthrix sp.]|nr:hypothetical protein [Candidatus Microthrix sp.]